MPFKITPSCTICKKEQVNINHNLEERACDICGQETLAQASCEEGHIVCALCRQHSARQSIIDACLKTQLSQPLPIMIELMKLSDVAMHGPEHHLLLPAALLTAYAKEKKLEDRLLSMLEEANKRSLDVPGGACGYWGICGAAIGTGIYTSIVTQSNPLASQAWGQSGQVTAKAANAVSAEGGPRCCKRDSFLSLIEAVSYSKTNLDSNFEAIQQIRCEFYPNNKTCKLRACPFFPTNVKA